MDEEDRDKALKAPLINRDEKPEVKATPAPMNETKMDSQMDMLKRIAMLGKFPVIAMIFHPQYIICNTILFR